MKFLMNSIGIRQFQQLIEKERNLTNQRNAIKSNENSPTRFEIVFESVKYPHDQIGLFSSPRTMRFIPSNMKNINESLTSINQNPEDPKTSISSELLQELESYAKSIGVSSIGYVKLPRELIFKNKAVLHRNAIILSLEMDKEKIELAPSSKTSAMIMRTYDNLGKASNQLTSFLRKHSYSAQAGHPLGGLVLYPPLAELAGIGYHGKHGLIITPEHGSRVRLAAIYTNIENLPFNEKNPHEWIKHFCRKCGRCIRKCPGFAIYDDPILHDNGLLTHIKNEYCFPVFLEYHGCSICIKECPFSRVDYERLKKQFDTKTLDSDMI
jgi:NAD-dependent dihydropyrimidine dehydrogenase PreA subunit